MDRCLIFIQKLQSLWNSIPGNLKTGDIKFKVKFTECGIDLNPSSHSNRLGFIIGILVKHYFFGRIGSNINHDFCFI